MPFPKSAQSKGGRAAASDRQKTIAKQTILKTQPWEKSTGPTTKEGLQAVTENVRCELVFRFGCMFESKDSAVTARKAFLSKAGELHRLLKSMGLGVVNSLVVIETCYEEETVIETWYDHEKPVTEVCYDEKETVSAKFSATLRGPTPEGLAIGKQWFSDKTWLQ